MQSFSSCSSTQLNQRQCVGLADRNHQQQTGVQPDPHEADQ